MRFMKPSKLIVFQLRLPHRRLATNDYLHKIGLKMMTFTLSVRMVKIIKEKNYSIHLVLELK